MGRAPERDEDPITLKEACELVFRDTVTPATLRAETSALVQNGGDGGESGGGIGAYAPAHTGNLAHAEWGCDPVGGSRVAWHVAQGAGGDLRPPPPRFSGGSVRGW